MARLRTNFVSGYVDNNPLAIGGLTLDSTDLEDLEVVAGADYAVITLDPDKRYGDPEIVYVTVHTSTAQSATITRAQENTLARAHVQGTKWVHGPTELDWDHGNMTGLSDDDHSVYVLAAGGRTITGNQGLTRTSTTDRSIDVKIVGDTEARLEIYADGKMQWGAGSASAPDTNLYRTAADSLKTDDNFTAGGGTVFIGADCSIYRSGADALQTDDAFRVNSTLRADGKTTISVATSTTVALGLKASADAVDRFRSDASGKMEWGDGTNPVDTNFYRNAADTLKTDDTLVVNRLDVGSITYAFAPVGMVSPFAGTTAPTGWLLCYGQAVSRTTYSALWTLIGTTYGSGDGVNTFNLPDTRGRVIAGLDNMGGSAASRLTSTVLTASNTMGATGGAQTHALSNGENSSHSHTMSHTHTVTIGSHFHTFPLGLSVWVNTAAGPYYAINDTYVSGGNPPHSFSIVGNTESTNLGSPTTSAASSSTTGTSGSSTAHTNTQPTIVMTCIIKY
jgi:microcystin-dependent protein